MTENVHTPTPWMAKKHGSYWRIGHSDELTVARTYGDSLGDEQDAAHIVCAVNAHAGLVEALEDAERVCEWGEPQPQPVLQRIRAALATAKE